MSAEQQISAALLTTSKLDKFDLETLHDAATSIFNQYLSEKVSVIFFNGFFSNVQPRQNFVHASITKMEVVIEKNWYLKNLWHECTKMSQKFRKEKVVKKLKLYSRDKSWSPLISRSDSSHW